jgi:hypothetical protein
VAGIDEQFVDWRQQLTLIVGQPKKQLKRALASMEKSRGQVANQEALSFLMSYTSACLQRVLAAKQRKDGRTPHATTASSPLVFSSEMLVENYPSHLTDGFYSSRLDEDTFSLQSEDVQSMRSGMGRAGQFEDDTYSLRSEDVQSTRSDRWDENGDAGAASDDLGEEGAWLQHWYAEGEKVAGIDEQFVDWRQQMYFIASQSERKLQRAM